MASIKNLAQLKWDRLFYENETGFQWPDELTERSWNRRGLIARKVKTGITDAIKKHKVYFEKNMPSGIWGRNWQEADKDYDRLLKWINKEGKQIRDNFKDLEDKATDAQKVYKNSIIISKQDVARAKEVGDAASAAVNFWNPNSLIVQLKSLYKELRKKIYNDQARLLKNIFDSTPKVPVNVSALINPLSEGLENWDSLNEQERKVLKQKIGGDLQKASRNMTQSLSNYIKSADMGIQLDKYNERECKELEKILVKYGNNPGAIKYANDAADDVQKLKTLVNNVKQMHDKFVKYVVPVKLKKG